MNKEEIAKRVWSSFPKVDVGRCLYNSITGFLLLQAEGLNVQIHAGSMSWPIIDLDKDDGVSPTHFSFMWSPDDAASVIAMIEGRMPEMHVWLWLPDTKEIVDFTTHEIVERAKTTANLEWTVTLPPPFVWLKFNELPKGVAYSPNVDAVHLTNHFIREVLNDKSSHV